MRRVVCFHRRQGDYLLGEQEPLVVRAVKRELLDVPQGERGRLLGSRRRFRPQ